MRQITITKKITERDEALQTYLSQISHYQLLTADEEAELARQIRQGGTKGRKAFDRLVNANLRFVVTVANSYQHQGLSLLDLISEGNIGLMKAAERFDETRGSKFLSFAVWHIRQSIMQAIADKGRMVRLPSNQINDLRRIFKAISEFERQFGRKPSYRELSDITKMAENKIAKVMEADTRAVSISAPIQEGEDNTIADRLHISSYYLTDSAVDYTSMLDDMNLVMHALLTPREKKIVCESYGIGCKEKSLQEIGMELGLTRERVRQVRVKAINKLATSIGYINN